ncbi:unnamed protein product [Caenorhabditis bovis]|uniref:VASt domain-containing protein n=1 Tax=Caenorhabditis bovis TaxID=2654633 RepID=A0A8S1F3H0_9PELO|nr:unnamed protein product [Caenorhabditis bovis]
MDSNISMLPVFQRISRRTTSLRSRQQRSLDIVDEGREASSQSTGLLSKVSSAIGSQKGLRRSFSARTFRSSATGGSNETGYMRKKRSDESIEPMTRTMSKKEKYFSEQTDKNIFMKLIHPSYQMRNQQFKKLFVDKGHVEQSDVFLASYSCAYQREILAQGRMFICQSTVCFYANIFGWETVLVIPVAEIEAITKRRAALIFPNSIQIEKKTGDKFFFASFANRDKSLSILKAVFESVKEGKKMTPEDVWEMLNHEDEKMIDSSRTSTTRSTEATRDNISQSSSGSAGHSTDDDYPEVSFEGEMETENSEVVVAYEGYEEEASCQCNEHVGRLIMDAVFPISVSKIYNLLYTNSQFAEKFNRELKNKDYVASEWIRDREGNDTRNCTYAVSLNHAMAPKNIIVNERQVLTYFPNKEDGFKVMKDTQNSGVPYADHFTVQCLCCFTRVDRNTVRVRVHGGIHYKKNVWNLVKGYIEKGTHQGLDDHYNLLERLLKEECERVNSSSDSTVTVVRQRKRESKIEKRLSGGGEQIVQKKIIEPQQSVTPAPNVTPTIHVPDYSNYFKIGLAMLAFVIILLIMIWRNVAVLTLIWKYHLFFTNSRSSGVSSIQGIPIIRDAAQ